MNFSALGVDRAIALTILNRFWSLIAGPITVIFIVAKLTPIEQGFYYAFMSVLGLQVFFELGFGFVILQTVSHLMAQVKISNNELIGDTVAQGKIGRLLASSFKWYLFLSVCFVLVVTMAGVWLWSDTSNQGEVEWRAAWSILVIVFGGSIVTNAAFSFVEGMGWIADVACARLIQNIVAITVLWGSLISGQKLMSLALMYCANLCVALIWLGLRYGKLFYHLTIIRTCDDEISWRHDIWPFQWRIAISWIAGYLGSQAITPIVFHQLGPVEAGRVGLSLTIMSAASAGALAWITTKSAIFGRLIAQRRFEEADGLFSYSNRRAILVASLAITLIVFLTVLLPYFWPQIGTRILPIIGMALLGIAAIANVQISAYAVFLRGYRREPFMVMSVASGLCICLVTLVMSHWIGTMGVLVGYAIISISIALFWCRPIFKRCAVEFRE